MQADRNINDPAQPPATQPPQMPPLGDQQFDQKARIYEAWQRERSIAATTALASAQNRGAAAAEQLLATPPHPDLLAAINRLAGAIEGMPAPGGEPAPVPAWVPELRAALIQAQAGLNAAVAALNTGA